MFWLDLREKLITDLCDLCNKPYAEKIRCIHKHYINFRLPYPCKYLKNKRDWIHYVAELNAEMEQRAKPKEVADVSNTDN